MDLKPVPQQGLGSKVLTPSAESSVDIVNKYNASRDGVDALIISAPHPVRAIVSFSSMNPGKFERWSWFHERHLAGWNELYIVLKDDSQHYYLGTDDAPLSIRHHKFISAVLNEFGVPTGRTYAVGSSMGGYAALYYSFWLGFAGAIAVNPQTDYASARRHRLQNWERQIRQTGSQWVDLRDYIFRTSHLPKLHIEHGDHPADHSAAESLINALNERRTSYTRKFLNDAEHGGASLTKDRMFSIIEHWEKEDLI